MHGYIKYGKRGKEMKIIIIIIGFLLFSCDNPIESQVPVESNSLSKGGGGMNPLYSYSYLVTAVPTNFVDYFDITYYLHRDQNIAVGIYSNPPIELRQIVIGNQFQLRGVHTLRIFVEPQIEAGKFYWVKMIMEDRDFFTYIFRSDKQELGK